MQCAYLCVYTCIYTFTCVNTCIYVFIHTYVQTTNIYCVKSNCIQDDVFGRLRGGSGDTFGDALYGYRSQEGH